MATELKLRRGTAAEHESFTGAVGEVTVDTTAYSLRVHDGVKVGGHSVELQAIARSLNVGDGQVQFTDYTGVLDDVKYLYDRDTQITYGVPTLSTTGETISNVVGNVLATTSGTGANSYTLNSVLIENTVFSSVEKLKECTSITTDQLDLYDVKAQTHGYYGGWASLKAPQGAATYILTKLSRILAVDAGYTVDGYGDHYLFGGTTYVAKLLVGSEVRPEEFGVTYDGITDDYASLRAAGDYCRLNLVPKMTLKAGVMRLSQNFEVDWQATILGSKGTFFGANDQGTTLLFDNGVDGISVVRAANSASGGLGDDSIIKSIRVACAGDNSNTSGNGVSLFARAFLEDIDVLNFGEDGFHIVATANNNSDNANYFTLLRCKSSGNGRDGFYIDGADVNAGELIGCNATSNGRINFNDSSFLGNTHMSAHSANPGKRAFGKGSDGFGYRCILDHVSTADTIPVTGSNWETYWEYWATSTSYATIEEGVKYYDSRAGEDGNYPIYHYFSSGANSINVFIGCYSEGATGEADGGSYISNRNQVYGGSIGSIEPEGYRQAYRANVSPVEATTHYDDSVITSSLGDSGGTIPAAFTFQEAVPDVKWSLRWDSVNAIWRMGAGDLSANRTYYLCDKDNSLNRPIGFLDFGGMGCGIGGKRHTALPAEPTSGDYERGDIIYNTNPVAGGYLGWVCTVAGTAGSGAVFKTFGAISS